MNKKRMIIIILCISLSLNIYTLYRLNLMKYESDEKDHTIVTYVYDISIFEIQNELNKYKEEGNEFLDIIMYFESIKQSSHTAMIMLVNQEYQQSAIGFFNGIYVYMNDVLQLYYYDNIREDEVNDINSNLKELKEILQVMEEEKEDYYIGSKESEEQFEKTLAEFVDKYPENEILKLYEFYK